MDVKDIRYALEQRFPHDVIKLTENNNEKNTYTLTVNGIVITSRIDMSAIKSLSTTTPTDGRDFAKITYDTIFTNVCDKLNEGKNPAVTKLVEQMLKNKLYESTNTIICRLTEGKNGESDAYNVKIDTWNMRATIDNDVGIVNRPVISSTRQAAKIDNAERQRIAAIISTEVLTNYFSLRDHRDKKAASND